MRAGSVFKLLIGPQVLVNLAAVSLLDSNRWHKSALVIMTRERQSL